MYIFTIIVIYQSIARFQNSQMDFLEKQSFAKQFFSAVDICKISIALELATVSCFLPK